MKIPLEETMATHSSTLAWKIPWTEEPDGLQSVKSKRIRHDWARTGGVCVCVRVRVNVCVHVCVCVSELSQYPINLIEK